MTLYRLILCRSPVALLQVPFHLRNIRRSPLAMATRELEPFRRFATESLVALQQPLRSKLAQTLSALQPR